MDSRLRDLERQVKTDPSNQPLIIHYINQLKRSGEMEKIENLGFRQDLRPTTRLVSGAIKKSPINKQVQKILDSGLLEIFQIPYILRNGYEEARFSNDQLIVFSRSEIGDLLWEMAIAILSKFSNEPTTKEEFEDHSHILTIILHWEFNVRLNEELLQILNGIRDQVSDDFFFETFMRMKNSGILDLFPTSAQRFETFFAEHHMNYKKVKNQLLKVLRESKFDSLLRSHRPLHASKIITLHLTILLQNGEEITRKITQPLWNIYMLLRELGMFQHHLTMIQITASPEDIKSLKDVLRNEQLDPETYRLLRFIKQKPRRLLRNPIFRRNSDESFRHKQRDFQKSDDEWAKYRFRKEQIRMGIEITPEVGDVVDVYENISPWIRSPKPWKGIVKEIFKGAVFKISPFLANERQIIWQSHPSSDVIEKGLMIYCNTRDQGNWESPDKIVILEPHLPLESKE